MALIRTRKLARFDRAHFKEFGDSSYVFEVVYYTLDPDYNLYMDCQQHINLELCRQSEEHGIEFAYPTRTLHLESHTGPAMVSFAPGVSSSDGDEAEQEEEGHGQDPRRINR